MKNYEERNALVTQMKWTMLAWSGEEDERLRKHVTVQCSLDARSFKTLPYHSSLAKWKPMLNHKQCHHPKPQKTRKARP